MLKSSVGCHGPASLHEDSYSAISTGLVVGSDEMGRSVVGCIVGFEVGSGVSVGCGIIAMEGLGDGCDVGRPGGAASKQGSGFHDCLQHST